MFENIIGQNAVLQLKDDVLSGRLAPAMLFFGPSGGAKGSAALELARVLSCQEDGSWKCSCSACERHRYLRHTDLLILGSRPFLPEIAACHSAVMRNPGEQKARLLFFRSIRKLQSRFSPVLGDDKKIKEMSSVLQKVEEGLDDFLLTGNEDQVKLEKICAALAGYAHTLAEEGVGSAIPIGHIRSASAWCGLTPNGKRKVLIIENAQNMRDEARNALLKLLEEPPSTVSIVLAARSREALIPTILSRLRPYRFVQRSAETEKEIIRRVFLDSADNIKTSEAENSLLNAYLDSRLRGNREKIYLLAAWFLVSVARVCAYLLKKKRNDIPPVINDIGERYAPIADGAGFERSVKSDIIIKKIMEESGNFEDESFSRFLKICLDMVSAVVREKEPGYIAYGEIFRKYIIETETAVKTLNINAASALEALFFNLKKSIIEPALFTKGKAGAYV